MAKLNLAYVQAMTDRHGQQRHYFRRPGYPRATLPGLPGTTEFMAAYARAMGQAAPEIGGAATVKGSFSDLIVRYYLSAGFRQLRPSTQRTYRNLIEAIRAKHGDKPVACLEARHVRVWMDAKVETPTAANAMLKAVRVLMRFAVERDMRKDDPTQHVRKLTIRSEGHHPWTDDELARFEAHWAIGTRARLAYALLLHTAQRRSDVVTMGRQHVKDGLIAVLQQKTRRRLLIPMGEQLRAALDAMPAYHLTFLTTSAGKPFTSAGFGNWFRECCDAAGLPAVCTAHGLRKAAARRLAEAGCSTHEIAAITGHTTLAEVARYTAAADQVRLAGEAQSKLGRNPARP